MIKKILAILAGAVMPLAFAPFNYYLLAILSLLVLFYLCLENSPRRNFVLGFYYGLGYFAVGVSWVQISIHKFGLPLLTFSVSMTLLFVLALAMFPALFAYVAGRFSKHSLGLRLLIIYPTIWVILEWTRSWFLTGFPWLTLGYSQIDSPLSGYAAITGVYGISLMMAISAGAICLLIISAKKYVLISTVCLLTIWLAAFGLQKVDWTQATGEPIKVAMIQGNITQEIKFLPGQRERTLELYSNLSEPYWKGYDLIIWPETAIPDFAHEVAEYIDQIQKKAQQSQTDILIGVPMLDPVTKDYYNSVLALGGKISVYKKDHLVPFGEFFPFKFILRPLLEQLDIPMSDFSPGGADKKLISTSKHQVGISICYEDVFGEEVITALPEADFLVNVSNDAWFGDSYAPHQHLQMAQMRALETGRYLLRSTNTGISAVIDQKGKIEKRAKQFEVATLTTEIRSFEGMTLYAKWGNRPVIGLCFLLLLLIFLFRDPDAGLISE